MLNKTVQWETHTLSAGVPVFGFNTKQKFAPQPLDNVLDEGGWDYINRDWMNINRDGEFMHLISSAFGNISTAIETVSNAIEKC